MANTSRLATANEGQLHSEFRSRILSGFHPHLLSDLSTLISGIGAPCWASGPTAAALQQLDGFVLQPPFHVVVPRDRNVRRLGHVVHTSEHLDEIDVARLSHIPLTAPARTLIDLAVDHTPSRLATALEGALRDELFTEDFLHRRIEDLRSQGRYGIPRLLEVIESGEIDRGEQSWLEREFLRLIAAADLPRPLPQQVLAKRRAALVRVDFRFPGTTVVVEVLGYRWHRTTAQIAIDAERLNRLLLDGFHPLQFTYSQVVKEPDYVIATVREALARSFV